MANRMMHETLVMACAEGTAQMGQSFGNVFAQVDFLCKRCGVAYDDRRAIQTMRKHSNSSDVLAYEDLMYDVRALCLFISAVFKVDVPSELVEIIPHSNRPRPTDVAVNNRYIRCIVDSWDVTTIHATIDDESGGRQIDVDYSNDERHNLSYLARLLTEGMQLNLLDSHVDGDRVRPDFVVVEPDFLVDISSIAACFSDYGHNPLAYTVNRLRPKANSQAILLGNFASSALDDIINNNDFNVNRTVTNSFKEQALQFCSCPDFCAETFIKDAKMQSDNLKDVVRTLFGGDYDRKKAILEPSFVCERLGLQGRVDLMTTDLSLLVEQKSGKNMYLGRQVQTVNKLSYYIESHYVQLLLYYGVLRYNFGVSPDKVDMRLLYSKYPAQQGLIIVNYYRALFLEAIKLRNRIVAGEYAIARCGWNVIERHLYADSLNESKRHDRFFEQYIRPQTEQVTNPLHCLSSLENAYFQRMATFVYREQIAQRVGVQEGVSGSMADLWNMPLAEKKETGNIFTDLTIVDKQRSTDYNGYDLVTLNIPAQGDDFLPNFRRGDMVYLYRYEGQPDVRRNILYKGVVDVIEAQRLVIKLNDGQQNPDLLADGNYAVEHGGSDIGSTSSLRCIHTFVSSSSQQRNLLLGQREPHADTTLSLTRLYHPDYDDIVLRAKQARDYFLLVGPPGTGKTSMALHFLVEEELACDGCLLLTAYTNRAVDEICGMLVVNGIDFIRIGNESSCDPRYKDHLLEASIEDNPRLNAIKEKISRCRVMVATTSTLLSRSFLFNIKHFSLTIVDEASQILEPGIIGLLKGRFILIGDHKQLPAVVAQSEIESRVDEPILRDICLTDCRNSLFERLLRWEERCGRSQFVGTLRKQGRMHPDIAKFPNEMFYCREQLVPVPCEHQLEDALSYDAFSEDSIDEALKHHRMMFIPVDEPANGGGQKSNEAEARLVADILRRIKRFYGKLFNPYKTIGVIVPYRNQIAMIRKAIAQQGVDGMDDVSIDTVERYQGSQRDVIIYSFTVTRAFQLSFLTSNTFFEDGHPIDRKLNVAITRARKQLIMLGCEKVLLQNTLFAKLIDRYKVQI